MLLLVVITAPLGWTQGADQAVESVPVVTTVGEALAHRVIGVEQSWHDVRSYCSARVRPMPDVTTRAAWEAEAESRRRAIFEEVLFRGAAAAWRDAPTRVEWLDTRAGGPGYRIRAVRYEALPGLWIPALLYEPEGLSGRVPVVVNVNGHAPEGKAVEYKQIRCINQAKRGMIALNLEWIGMGQLKTDGFNHFRSNQLDLCGTNGVAVHYLALTRGLNLLLDHPHADPERVAVTGLSGGGWQTILLSALDRRVTLANPVAGYSSYHTRAEFPRDLGDSEQTPVDLAMIADYTHLTAMRAPRPTLLTYNAHDDCCFRADNAVEPLVRAAEPVFGLYRQPHNLRTHVNEEPGTHNFEIDNRQQLYRMLGDHFFPGDAIYRRDEIDVAEEVKSPEELHVHLPEPNLDFQRLAIQLMDRLPAPPAGSDDEQRRQLARVLRYEPYETEAVEVDRFALDAATVCSYRLRLSGGWTMPATELVPAGPSTGTVMLLADGGRRSCGEEATALLAAGKRVVAVDPLWCGEAAVSEKPELFALLVSSVGGRPLGIQAAHVVAAATWAVGRAGGPIEIHAQGRRTSLMALVAVALHPQLCQRLEMTGSLESLKDLIRENRLVTEAPELFCFGLLEATDIGPLQRLARPCAVVTR